MRTLFERLPRLVIAILLLFLSVFLLTLYFTQKGHPEYLWLALHELVQVPTSIIDQASSSALLDNIWSGGLYLQLVFISAYLYFEFLVAFLALNAAGTSRLCAIRHRYWRLLLRRFCLSVTIRR